MKRFPANATMVPVHAAWADACSWSAVVAPLLKEGLGVIATQIPMTSLFPAWRRKPSWYLLAEDDRMFRPKAQRFVAERMGAQVRSHDVDHASQISSPALVVEFVLEAARALP